MIEFCTTFVMKVDEKSGRVGNYRGRMEDCFRAHMQKIQLALVSNGLQSRGPLPIVCPRITK